MGRGGHKNQGKQGYDQLTWKHSGPHVVLLNEQNRL
jgi:hypothetical protein